MAKAEFFLAFKAPHDKPRYYEVQANSGMRFHFVDLEGQNQLSWEIAETDQIPSFPKSFIMAPPAPRKSEQIALYQKAIESMRSGPLDKVVLSRVEHHHLDIAPLSLFEALAKKYSEAAVYLFSAPEAGTWLGASPENLLSLEGNRIHIDSLAGTKTWDEKDSFGDKEYEEQDLVSREISELLESSPMIKNHAQGDLKLLKAGNLAHLHTKFEAEITESFDLGQFLIQLQPTPAVGGRPRHLALEFLKEYELYPRRFYTGYFGFSGAQSGRFWVNLRCAEVCEDQILSIYVGGGLTAQSNAEAEWQETVAKAQTIINVLKDPND